jgi:hypothetical protein
MLVPSFFCRIKFRGLPLGSQLGPAFAIFRIFFQIHEGLSFSFLVMTDAIPICDANEVQLHAFSLSAQDEGEVLSSPECYTPKRIGS